MKDSNIENPTYSLVNDVGENYHYAKTIINNKIEILKLELLQHISKLGNLIVLAFFALFFAMIVIALLIAAFVVYMAQALDSYLYALLVAVAIFTLISGILFKLLQPRLLRFLERKLINLT